MVPAGSGIAAAPAEDEMEPAACGTHMKLLKPTPKPAPMMGDQGPAFIEEEGPWEALDGQEPDTEEQKMEHDGIKEEAQYTEEGPTYEDDEDAVAKKWQSDVDQWEDDQWELQSNVSWYPDTEVRDAHGKHHKFDDTQDDYDDEQDMDETEEGHRAGDPDEPIDLVADGNDTKDGKPAADVDADAGDGGDGKDGHAESGKKKRKAPEPVDASASTPPWRNKGNHDKSNGKPKWRWPNQGGKGWGGKGKGKWHGKGWTWNRGKNHGGHAWDGYQRGSTAAHDAGLVPDNKGGFYLPGQQGYIDRNGVVHRPGDGLKGKSRVRAGQKVQQQRVQASIREEQQAQAAHNRELNLRLAALADKALDKLG